VVAIDTLARSGTLTTIRASCCRELRSVGKVPQMKTLVHLDGTACPNLKHGKRFMAIVNGPSYA
jgi:hypothetical protein